MPTISVEVIAPLISGAKHCQHCQNFIDDAGISQRVQEEELSSYPEEMWRDYARLSQLVRDLSARYGGQLRITLIDPHTPMGLWKSLRHWVRSYPTFIVNGHAKYAGWELGRVEGLLREGGAVEGEGYNLDPLSPHPADGGVPGERDRVRGAGRPKGG